MSGYVTVGMAPTTATVLALPLINAMRERYPDIQLHLVEMLSGHLATQLNARQIDLAIVFQLEGGKRWSVTPLLDEKLFVISSPHLPHAPQRNAHATGGSGATSTGDAERATRFAFYADGCV